MDQECKCSCHDTQANCFPCCDEFKRIHYKRMNYKNWQEANHALQERLDRIDHKFVNAIREITKRLEKLEETSEERAHLINFKSYFALADRITELERWKEAAIEKNIQDTDRMRNLEKQIADWEEEFYFLKDKLRNDDKKPHKCPVCDGKGKDKDKLVAEPYDQHIKVLVSPDCKSCEGKGIVWG